MAKSPIYCDDIPQVGDFSVSVSTYNLDRGVSIVPSRHYVTRDGRAGMSWMTGGKYPLSIADAKVVRDLLIKACAVADTQQAKVNERRRQEAEAVTLQPQGASGHTGAAGPVKTPVWFADPVKGQPVQTTLDAVPAGGQYMALDQKGGWQTKPAPVAAPPAMPPAMPGMPAAPAMPTVAAVQPASFDPMQVKGNATNVMKRLALDSFGVAHDGVKGAALTALLKTAQKANA